MNISDLPQLNCKSTKDWFRLSLTIDWYFWVISDFSTYEVGTCNLGNCESLISQSLVVAVVLWVMLVFSYMSIVGGWLIRTEWDQRDKRFRVLSQIELIHARLKGGTNIRSEPPWIAGFYSSSKPRRRRRVRLATKSTAFATALTHHRRCYWC